MSGTGDPVLRFLGGLLLAIGLLIATVTGLCVLSLGLTHIGTTLSYAAIPFFIGIVLIALGLAMLYAR